VRLASADLKRVMTFRFPAQTNSRLETRLMMMIDEMIALMIEVAERPVLGKGVSVD
jgi:hypothetical protein